MRQKKWNSVIEFKERDTMKAIRISMQERDEKRLDAFCQRSGESKEQFVTHLIENYLSRNDSDATRTRLNETHFEALRGVVDEPLG